ncbi:hypothetical protein CROQUDRAFT_681092 [Cronartium quercuum f. sp. fusiforme G11]|uniref:Uncharacterized protein n=1 Tax=Cronartium quercuum f. sp. fusiforme G11 TaxID=708437 RepID=A0A9P6NB81_9BASI|nr:hypothetical protein CROQUDRAFT_681092 [Cronartium quercuum f. sp. fusiforme G11]
MIKLPNKQKVQIGFFVALEDRNEKAKIGCVIQSLGNQRGGEHECYAELTLCDLTTILYLSMGCEDWSKGSGKYG